MNILSIFVDESGDFGKYDSIAPFYLLTLVLHEQSRPLSTFKLNKINNDLVKYFPSKKDSYVHSGPIIRKEKEFEYIGLKDRRHIFNSLFYFAISSDIRYKTFSVDKRKDDGSFMWLNNQLLKQLNFFITEHFEYLMSFDQVKMYYDFGQKEITTILNSTFFSRLTNYLPPESKDTHHYRLFQVADLICTFELLNLKCTSSTFSKSEMIFFGNPRLFKKNYYKQISRKKL
ncbi:MAG: DUF3800 domain-containing protein [Erysipelotrichaceae bacterium]|nr:DUF3800 domain-containing protein [Erysipelotrichaceae bacterium]